MPRLIPQVHSLPVRLLRSGAVLALLIASGCSEDTTPGTKVDLTDGDSGKSDSSIFGPKDDGSGIELLPGTDVVETPDIQILPGEFGYACESASDCNSGLCVDSAAGKICTTSCSGDCPKGFLCSEQKTTSGDTLFLCAPKYKFLCDPCNSNTDCNDQGQSGNVCMPFGDGGSLGSFCGAICDPFADDCPEGYKCNSVTDPVSGKKSSQCQKTTGACTCSSKAIEGAKSTTCKEANVTGTCSGSRQCTVDGLSECDAPVPAAETCNDKDDDCNGKTDDFSGQVKCDIANEFGTCIGVAKECVGGKAVCEGNTPAPETCDKIDNDCDGETDEDLCDDGNPCTKGICNSDGSCLQQQTNGAVCDDGSQCTQTDKCLQGNCLGGNPLKCDDSDPCTADSCDPFSGCVHQPSSDAVCPDDGDKCTVDQCKGGKCVHDLIPEGGLCNDGDDCTVNDKCLQGKCISGPKNLCNDNNPCTKDYCAPGTGCVNSTEEGDGLNCNSNLSAECPLGVCSAGQCYPKPNEKCETEVEVGLCDEVKVQGTCTAAGKCVADPASAGNIAGGYNCPGCKSVCVKCFGVQLCLDFIFAP
jgi:hypothetical protein